MGCDVNRLVMRLKVVFVVLPLLLLSPLWIPLLVFIRCYRIGGLSFDYIKAEISEEFQETMFLIRVSMHVLKTGEKYRGEL